MSDALKPCPFCGGAAKLDTARGYRAADNTAAWGNMAAVHCTDCLAEVSFCYEDAPATPGDEIVGMVIGQWNKRALAATPADGWNRNMDEAPRDGTHIWVALPVTAPWRFSEAYWVADGALSRWQAADSTGIFHALHPSHWRHLPPAPAETDERKVQS